MIFIIAMIFIMILLSAQGKRCEIISDRDGTYELTHQMANEVRLRILGS